MLNREFKGLDFVNMLSSMLDSDWSNDEGGGTNVQDYN